MTTPSDTERARDAARELERALAAARELEVAPEHRAAYVRGLRASAGAPVRRVPRALWPTTAWAAAASIACAVLALRMSRQAEPAGHAPVAGPALPTAATSAASPIVSLGARVAFIAEPGARYEVSRHTETETRLYVREGTVAVRLLPGPGPHRLTVGTDDLWAEATGTTFTVAVTKGGSSVTVHAGTVHVRGPAMGVEVHAGQRLSAGVVERSGADSAAARELAAWTPPGPSAAEAAGAGLVAQRLPAPSRAPVGSARSAAPGPAAGAAPAAMPEERWREARILEGRGAYESAAAILEDLARGSDPVWAPIALAELVGLRASWLASPDAAIEAGDEFLRRFPGHGLATEVRALVRDARRQRGDPLPASFPPTGP